MEKGETGLDVAAAQLAGLMGPGGVPAALLDDRSSKPLLVSVGIHGGPRWPCSPLAFSVAMPHLTLGRRWVVGALGPQLLLILGT